MLYYQADALIDLLYLTYGSFPWWSISTTGVIVPRPMVTLPDIIITIGDNKVLKPENWERDSHRKKNDGNPAAKEKKKSYSKIF